MKISTLLLVLLPLACPAAAADRPRVEELAWLAGCWAAVGGEAGSGEQWTVPAGGTMLGVGRTVRQSRTRAHEFLVIRETEAGEIEFVANPSGQAETAFRLVRMSATDVTFENPAHDFPQRIIYRLEPDGALQARIEGAVNGQHREVKFPMHRVDCVTGAS